MGMRSGCALALLLLTGVSVCGQEIALEPSDTQANPFASHDFGQVAVGSNASYTYSPINLLNAPSLKAGTEFSLTPATSSSYILNFTPRYPGLRSDSILASGVTPAIVPVKGVGVAPQAVIWPGVITTVVGGSISTDNPNLTYPRGIAVDPAGNVYYADIYSNVIRRIDATTGSLTTVAGNATLGYSGDGGAATSAQLFSPYAIAFDLSGNLYIADSYNYVVRRVDAATGVISTIAGTGRNGASVVASGVATSTALGYVSGVVVDSAGNLFFSDSSNSAIYKLPAGTSTLSLYAGTGASGYSGDGGPASSAKLNSPQGLAVDNSDNLYIAENLNVRKVNATTQVISTVAGSASYVYNSSPDGTLATAASFSTLYAVSVDAAGNIYIPDPQSQKVRIVSAATGLLSTVAGSGFYGYWGDDGPATSAALIYPYAAVPDAAGNVYIADSYKMRKVSVTSSMLNFTQATGTPTASLWNLGNSTLTLSAIDLPTGYSQISGANGDCTASTAVAPGGFCILRVTRASSAPQSAQLTVTDNSYNLSGNQQQATLVLNGGSPVISVSPPSLTFTRQAVGKTSSFGAYFTISNTGSADLALASISVAGANASDFSLSGCPTVVTLGASCYVYVTFLPTGAGNRTASVVISSNSVNAAQSVTLTGTAVIPAFRMYIDVPNSSHSALSGIATVSGWAASNLTTVSGVTLAVDGVPISTNFAGNLSRPDVCTAFPDTVGCPSVGWSFSLDTTVLPNGAHTLSIIATAANGTYAATSTPFTVANSISRSPVSAVIDAPDSSATYSGTVLFGGWALADYPISNVTVRVDGTFTGTAAYGALRPDVCSVFPGRPSCPYVGWNLSVDTTRYADGVHTLQITATAGSEFYTTSKQFTIANSSSGIHATIDSPNAQSQAFAGSVVIGGWVLADTQSISSVIVKVDGQSLGFAPYGGSRPDVCQVFTNATGCPAGNVGWSYLLNTGSLTNGAHTLSITAATGAGISATVAKPFTVFNSTSASATHVTIDSPSISAGPQIGILSVRGWALNDTGRVTQVAMTVDGAAYGFIPYGSFRPDVCVVYPGRQGCPNVGWSASVNTTLLSNGPHTLGITAVSGSQVYTESRTFTVANWTGIDPMIVTIDSPSANTGPVSGVVVLGGWAINTMSSISSVSAAVDGITLGTLYGLNAARPDVCALYSNAVDCPNVGWNFGLDTSTLPDGSHTVAITATASSGQRSVVTSPFTVANASLTSIHMAIDSPTEAPVSATITVSGWALDDAGTGVNVTILVDGISRTSASRNIARPDVCQVYPGRYACPNVGWSATLDTTQFANGTHVVEAFGTSGTNAHFTLGKTFTVAN